MRECVREHIVEACGEIVNGVGSSIWAEARGEI